MQISLLTPDKDPMGAAIADYYANGKATKLRVFSSMFDEDEIPVKQLFRNFHEMPEAERKALRISTGKILDVGAGSGCHSLALQEMGKEVKAIDISPLSIETMQKRGVKDVALQNFFSQQFTGSFDTILLLMNGSGIVGRIANLSIFFQTIKKLLAPGGCVLMDSSDLRYLFEDEEGDLDIDPEDDYYGEVDFRMQYKNIKGDSFDWLYIDFQTLSLHAANNGFKAEMIKEGEHFDYLAKIHRI
ncbi:methyltransferase domain-containing protein [Parabacteroides gordonii]|jgi:SAM-dependent methyltransferase|uniref:class I SAM-dependent methyltransferase n=1 Tax=Parabacteroides gordonii TaxID=574930 RepID=UPI00241C64F7|nr:methyltransferase domain-containing protein [Parabacteroides gordonii]